MVTSIQINKSLHPEVKTWTIVFLCWTAIGVLMTAKAVLYYELIDQPKYWYHLSFSKLAWVWSWALLSPFIYKIYTHLELKKFFSLNTIGWLLKWIIIISLIHGTLTFSFNYYLRWINDVMIYSFVEAFLQWTNYQIMGFINDLPVFLMLLLAINFIKTKNTLPKTESKSEPFDINYLSRITIKDNGRILLLNIKKVKWIQASGNYLKIKAGTKIYMVRKTLNDFTSQLDPRYFYRLNRSTVVNIKAVKEMQPWFNGEFTTILKDGLKINTGKSYRSEVNRLLQTN